MSRSPALQQVCTPPQALPSSPSATYSLVFHCTLPSTGFKLGSRIRSFHTLELGPIAGVEHSTGNPGKGQDIIDLVGIVAATSADYGRAPGCLLRRDWRRLNAAPTMALANLGISLGAAGIGVTVTPGRKIGKGEMAFPR